MQFAKWHGFLNALITYSVCNSDVQQEAGPALENLRMIFEDEIQVLMAFEIVWSKSLLSHHALLYQLRTIST